MKLLRLLVTIVLFSVYYYKVDSAMYQDTDNLHYYFSYPDKYNWYKAMEFCQAVGMFLIDIRSTFEQTRIGTVIMQANTDSSLQNENYWTSGTSLGAVDLYSWDTSGELIYWVNWASGFPGNGTSNCIYIDSSEGNKWKTQDCFKELIFICRGRRDRPIYPSMSSSSMADEESIASRRRKAKKMKRRKHH